MSLITDFPYKYLIYSEQHADATFEKLCHYQPNLIHMPYWIKGVSKEGENAIPLLFAGFEKKIPDTHYWKPTLLVYHNTDYEDYNWLSDFFQEEVRLSARRCYQHITSLEYWKINKKEIVRKAIEKYGNDSLKSLRAMVLELHYECKPFRPTIMISFIKLLKARRILDPCSGWGDRLIGAAACDIDYYYGVDPNFRLIEGYQAIIERFIAKDKQNKYNMICSSFENADLTGKNFDLVLTSPPYFNLEIYSEDKTQSVHPNISLDEWLNNFMFKLLDKSWSLLTKDGHLVLYMNNYFDPSQDKYIEYMSLLLEYMNTFKDAAYLGVISSAHLLSGDQPSGEYEIFTHGVHYREDHASNEKLIMFEPPISNNSIPELLIRSPQPLWIWRKK